MASSVRVVRGLVTGVATAVGAALLAAPAGAAPPEPYRVATGLEGAVSASHVALGDRVFWVSYGNSGTSSSDSELWTSDGTEAGTRELVDPNPGGFARVDSLQAFGDGLVFTADDGTHGSELWYSDGTAEGTAMVAALTAGADASTWLLDAGPGAGVPGGRRRHARTRAVPVDGPGGDATAAGRQHHDADDR